MLGPIPYGEPEEGRLERDPVAGEAALEPTAELVAGRRWRIAAAREGVLDFRDLFVGEPAEHAAAYALVHVLAPTPRWTTIAVGSDDGVSVRVNGVLFHEHDVPRGHRFGDDNVRVKLRRGWNRLLFKVVNGQGGFALSARFEEPAGLEFSVNPPEDRWIGPPEAPELLVRTVEAATPMREPWHRERTYDLYEHRFGFDVSNVGGQALGPLRLRLVGAKDEGPEPEEVGLLETWTSRRVEFHASLHSLLDASGKLPSLVVERDSIRQVHSIEGLDAGTALARLFGPFPIKEWVGGHRVGSSEWNWAADVGVPQDLTGVRARARILHPGPAEIRGDRAVEVPTFSGDSGWYPLGETRTDQWRFNVKTWEGHAGSCVSRSPSSRDASPS